jgi:hypothetical protein
VGVILTISCHTNIHTHTNTHTHSLTHIHTYRVASWRIYSARVTPTASASSLSCMRCSNCVCVCVWMSKKSCFKHNHIHLTPPITIMLYPHTTLCTPFSSQSTALVCCTILHTHNTILYYLQMLTHPHTHIPIHTHTHTLAHT